MLELHPPLASRLRQLRVHVDLPDEDTLILKNVPVHAESFSKSHTNLLVKRTHPGATFVLGVDEDLEYRGANADLLRSFAGATRRQGWRVLVLAHLPAGNQPEMVDHALRLLGADGKEPALPGITPRPAEGKLLGAFGVNLSALAVAGKSPITVGREEDAEELVSGLLRWGQARLPLVLGESGVGKTNLLHAAAVQLAKCRPELQLTCVDVAAFLAGTLFDAERENLLGSLFKEALANQQTVLALEHLELCLVGYAPLQMVQALDAGVKIMGTALSGHLPRFQVHPLWRRLHVLELAETDEIETGRILRAVCLPLARHHRLEIDPSCLGACIQAAGRLPGSFPAKAIDLLDAAASRAAVAGAAVLGPDDICHAAARGRPGME